MFRIKICGITNVEDALLAAEAGADAIGLNFFPGSPRYIGPTLAREIAAAIPAGLVKVGLFVNAAPAAICLAFDELRLDLIQLHGDEPPELLLQLGQRPVMRAMRVGGSGLAPVQQYLDDCRRLGCTPRMLLLDSCSPGQYGGSGRPGNWLAAADAVNDSGIPPIVLAGGLTPANVAQAVRTVRPYGVDTASGVESSPGRKSAEAVRAFVALARAALDQL